jgi:hypothetical protein
MIFNSEIPVWLNTRPARYIVCAQSNAFHAILFSVLLWYIILLWLDFSVLRQITPSLKSLLVQVASQIWTFIISNLRATFYCSPRIGTYYIVGLVSVIQHSRTTPQPDPITIPPSQKQTTPYSSSKSFPPHPQSTPSPNTSSLPPPQSTPSTGSHTAYSQAPYNPPSSSRSQAESVLVWHDA